MKGIEETAEDLEAGTSFETILDGWTPGRAFDLTECMVKRGWKKISPRNSCAVAVAHFAVEKSGTVLDIISYSLQGPYVSVTRYGNAST